MRNIIKKGGSLLVSAAMAAALVPGVAFASTAGGTGSVEVGNNTNWTLPDTAMTNVVTVDGKDYKVITTQTVSCSSVSSMAGGTWSTAGPDWLGISNSAQICNNSSGDNEVATELATNSMMGIWASVANEVPNAYNWNYFYNLYQDELGTPENKTSDFVVLGNGTTFDSESGTAAGLKYRPEVMWADSLSSNGNATTLGTMAQYIREGKYFVDGEAGCKQTIPYTYAADGNGYAKGDLFANEVVENGASTTTDAKGNEVTIYTEVVSSGRSTTTKYYADEAKTIELTRGTTTYDFATDSSKYAAPHDADYNPIESGSYVVDQNGNAVGNVVNSSAYNSPLVVTALLYSTAQACEEVEAATANYDGMVNGQKVTAANATWKTVNALPRTTRYEASSENPMSARDCALAFEKLEKGANYYIASQIAAGKTTKKKVAYIYKDPTADSNVVDLIAFDGAESLSSGDNAGFAGVSPFAVEQVKGNIDEATEKTGSTIGAGAAYEWQVDADYIMENADYVIMTGVGGTNSHSSYTQASIKAWFTKHCTTAANKAKAATVQYDMISPAQTNVKNFTVEKAIYGLQVLDFVYADLFPNMELETYWYDNIYHITDQALVSAMNWTLAKMSLPAGSDLAKISKTYSREDMEKKFYEGYTYWTGSSTESIKQAVNADKGLVSGKGYKDGEDSMGFAYLMTPSSTYAAWAKDYAAKNAVNPTPAKATAKAQTISGKAKVTKTYKAAKKTKKLAKAKTVKLKTAFKLSAKTALSYKKTSGNSKITVTKAGKVTVKKGLKKGTYKVKVKVTAKATTAYKAATKTITLTVKVK